MMQDEQHRKEQNGCGAAKTATVLHLASVVPLHAAAPAQRNLAGVVAFITPDGTTVIRLQCWARVVKHAQRLRQQGASFTQVAAYLTQKARELETKFGWLKRLWAARLQRVLLRKALQKGFAQRWDNQDDDLPLSEANCLFTALQVLMREYRAPPELTQPSDACLFVTSLFIAPSVPRSKRAPTFALPCGGALAGVSFLTPP